MKRILLTGLLLVVLTIAAASWLLASESGLRWIYQQIESNLGDTLQVRQVSGSVIEGVELQGINFNDAGLTLTSDRLFLEIDLWALLSPKIHITQAEIEQLEIHLLKTEEPANVSPDSITLPVLVLPLAVQLDQLLVDQIRLTQGGNLYTLQQLQLQIETLGSQIIIDKLDTRLVDIAIDTEHHYDVDINIAGNIEIAGNYAHDLQMDWKTQLSSDVMIDNSTSISGDLKSTQLRHQSRGPLQANLSLQLKDLLQNPGWQAELELVGFDSHFVDPTLPALRGDLELSAKGDLQSARVTGRLNADSAEIGEFSTDFKLSSLDPQRLAEGLQIDSLKISVLDGEFAAKGLVYWSPMLQWSGEVLASDINPASLLPDWPGQLTARIKTEGSINNDQLDARASLEALNGRLRNYPLAASSELHWRDETLEVGSATLTSGTTRITADGMIGRKLDLDWTLSTEDLAELYPDASGLLTAGGHLGGEADAPVIEARFNGSSLGYRDDSMETVEGEINLDLLSWQQMDLRFSAAKLVVQGHQLQSIEVNANSEKTIARLIAAEVNALLEFSGKPVDNAWRGKLVTADIETSEFSNWHLQAPVEMNLGVDSISSERLCLLSAQEGEFCGLFQQNSEAWDIDLNLARIPWKMIQQWIPKELELDGVINATADLQYTDRGQLFGKVDAEFPASTARYWFEPEQSRTFDYQTGELNVSLQPQQVRVSTRLALSDGDHITGFVALPGAEVLQFDSEQQPIEGQIDIQAINWNLVDGLIPEIDELSGELRMAITIGGSIAKPRLQGSADFIDGGFVLQQPGMMFDQITAHLDSDGSDHLKFSLEAGTASGKIQLQGDTLLDQSAGWPSNVSFSGKAFELTQLLAPWKLPSLEIQGKLDADGELKFRAPDHLLGEIRLTSAAGKLNYPLVADELESWDYRDILFALTLNEQGLNATSGFVVGKNNRMQAELSLADARLLALDPETQPIQARATINFDELELLQHRIPEIDKVTGELALDVQIAGTLAQPQMTVSSTIDDASFTIPRLGLQINRVTLRGDTDQKGRFDYKLSAHSGDGDLSIEGSSQLDPELGWPSKFVIKGQNFEVSKTPEAAVTASPDLSVNIKANTITIEGDLLLPYAKLQPKDISTASRISEDTVIIGAEKLPEERWLVSTRVNLMLGERVTFYGFGFEGQLGGRLQLDDKPGEVSTGTGEITINDGRYRAYGQRLDVNNGRVLFTGGRLDNPGLDVRAIREVNDITVGLRVRGRLQQPEIELFSNPAMDQTDMLSYLILGRPFESASGTEGEQMSKAALALGLAGGDTLARQLGDRFGFDQVSVESNENDEASLVVGRYLSPKMYVSYGVGLVDSINSWNLRYQLTDRWHMEAESGQYQGADLFFSIER